MADSASSVPAPAASAPAPAPTSMIAAARKRFSWAKLKARIQSDPLVFGFLGLTVLALMRGMGAMMRNDKRQSQRMMRYRVAFQLSTVGALVGGIYWRAYKGLDDPNALKPSGLPAVDNRYFIKDGRNYDLPPGEQRAGAAADSTPAVSAAIDAAAAGGEDASRLR